MVLKKYSFRTEERSITKMVALRRKINCDLDEITVAYGGNAEEDSKQVAFSGRSPQHGPGISSRIRLINGEIYVIGEEWFGPSYKLYLYGKDSEELDNIARALHNRNLNLIFEEPTGVRS